MPGSKKKEKMESTTLTRMYAAAQRGEHADLVVRCDATPFALNYAVVAAECGYFRTMYATRIGAAPAAVTRTSLDECDPAHFALVVRCIYTGSIDAGIDLAGALGVLALAVFLDCGLAERLVTEHIDRSGWCFDTDTAVCVWVHANRVAALDARRLAAGHIAGAMPRATRAPALLALPKDELVALLSSDEFSARSECHVSEALCAWCDANDERCTALDSRVVRFVWHDPAPRDRRALDGILVLPVDARRFHFLTAGHEWVDGVVPDLGSPRGTGASLCHVPTVRRTYVVGGTQGACSVECHHGTDARWTPHDYSAASRSQVSCAAVGTCVYVAGGVSGIRPCEDVDVLDVASCLKGRLRMSRARRMCCLAPTAGGSLLVAGGFDAIGSALAHAEKLEPAGTAPPMLEPRAAAACAAVGADVYVAGGVGGVHAPVRTAEYYDAAREKWTALPPMPRARSHCAGASVGRAFYVIGGLEDGGQKADTLFRFDLATSAWSVHFAPAFGECAATAARCRPPGAD